MKGAVSSRQHLPARSSDSQAHQAIGSAPRVRQDLTKVPARYFPSRKAGPRIRSATLSPLSVRSARVSFSPHPHSKASRPSEYQSSSRPSRTSRSPQPHSRTIRSEASISRDRRIYVPPLAGPLLHHSRTQG